MIRKVFAPMCPICSHPVAGAWVTDEVSLAQALANGTRIVCEAGAWVHVASTKGQHILYLAERAQRGELAGVT